MTDQEIVEAVLSAAGVELPEMATGDLRIQQEIVDAHRLREFLSTHDHLNGWVMTTGAVTRVGGSSPRLSSIAGRILAADLYDAPQDRTWIIRAVGNQWQIRDVRPGSGPGLRVTRNWLALDGGSLRYQTVWIADEHGQLSPGLTRFCGFVA